MKTTGIEQEKIHDYDDERSVTIQTQNNPPTIVGGRLATTRTGAIFCHKTREYSPVCEATEANINDPQGHRTNVGTTSYAYVCDPIKRLTTTTMNTATSAYVYDASHRHFVMTVNRSVVQALAVVVHVGGSADAKWLQGMQRCSVAELTGSVGGEWYVDELLATQTSASNNDISGYTLCANEWDSFAFPSTCDVAYGAKGAFVFRSAQSGTITFSNATFGDPAPGAPKKGYYRLSGGQRFYAHANHLYSVAALTNAAGSVVERYRYDSYGQRTVLAPDGITTRAVSSYNQQVGFTGRYEDKETKLLYFRARMYSGTLGRFIERDPNMTLPWTEMNKQYKHRLGERRQLVGWMPVSMDGYQDGMLLYAAHFVPNATDPTGMSPCMGEDGNSLAGLDCCINKCLMWWSATTVGAWCSIPGLISAVPGSPAKAPYLTTGLFRKVMNRASVCCVGWLVGILIGCEAKCLGTNAGYDGLVP